MTRFYLRERKRGMKKGRRVHVNEFIRARAKEGGLVTMLKNIFSLLLKYAEARLSIFGRVCGFSLKCG